MKIEQCLLLREGIYKHNEKDPSDPEVLVKGVGRYALSQVEDNVKRKIADLSKSVANAKDFDDWKRIETMVNPGAMHEMIKTIKTVHAELEEKKNG
jgi:hypothetical protein